MIRIELFYRPEFTDGRARRLRASLEKNFHVSIPALSIIDVYLLDEEAGLSPEEMDEIFVDHVAQGKNIDRPAAGTDGFDVWEFLLEIACKPGVTDPVAITAEEAIANLRQGKSDRAPRVRTARQYLFSCPGVTEVTRREIFSSLFNPLIETELVISRAEWERGVRPPDRYASDVRSSEVVVREFDFNLLDDDALRSFSTEKLLALSLPEMRAVKERFQDPAFIKRRAQFGLSGRITDVEIEMIAQTWSEHCKHKIFNAAITFQADGKTERIKSLFTTFIKKTTDRIAKKKRYLLSVFHDNAGVIRFDASTSLCFKVETHNSPSALDPYGGAITGIVGVNRDILGTGKLARPLFNTNVLCFADPATPPEQVPEGFLHPRRILEGVHRGIIDGGNQSGIPTVAGSFLFDQSYIGKPLVFCGTGGILPDKIGGEASWIKHIDPGDLAVMVGGRIGKDGIHGATFSSLALDETSPTSAVQIGDPITQRKMWDFLEEARDRLLFKGITDNGAGGLSSSLGEMAQSSNGVRIELDRCPLKYQGLAPWEILVSESQERMSVAVDRRTIDAFFDLARRRDVEATVVGEFTDSGLIEIRHGGKTVGLLELIFLHDGLPVMELPARLTPVDRAGSSPEEETLPPLADLLCAVLADPNVCSRERLVRQYDHEVQGVSIVKPFVGAASDAHSDGAVLKPLFHSRRGITVTHGICPRFGERDAYQMAANAVDEAFRAHVALGGDPELTAALDNFCWPDPVQSPSNPDGAHKLAQLVETARGLADVCLAYGIPLISGKDSMKNDAWSGKKKISIRPTLLVSLIGIIQDVRQAVTTDFKQPDDLIYILGETGAECAGSILERVTGKTFDRVPAVDPERALPLYRALHAAMRQGLVRSCHDCAEGGLAAALVESAIGGRCGFEVSLDAIPLKSGDAPGVVSLLFSESASRFIVSVAPEDEKKFLSRFRPLPVGRLGRVCAAATLTVTLKRETLLRLPLEAAREAWQGVLA